MPGEKATFSFLHNACFLLQAHLFSVLRFNLIRRFYVRAKSANERCRKLLKKMQPPPQKWWLSLMRALQVCCVAYASCLECARIEFRVQGRPSQQEIHRQKTSRSPQKVHNAPLERRRWQLFILIHPCSFSLFFNSHVMCSVLCKGCIQRGVQGRPGQADQRADWG